MSRGLISLVINRTVSSGNARIQNYTAEKKEDCDSKVVGKHLPTNRTVPKGIGRTGLGIYR